MADYSRTNYTRADYARAAYARADYVDYGVFYSSKIWESLDNSLAASDFRIIKHFYFLRSLPVMFDWTVSGFDCVLWICILLLFIYVEAPRLGGYSAPYWLAEWLERSLLIGWVVRALVTGAEGPGFEM